MARISKKDLLTVADKSIKEAMGESKPLASLTPKAEIGRLQRTERLIRTSDIADLVTLDIDDSGSHSAAAFRDSYFRLVEEHDGPTARKLLNKHFQSHPSDDPYTFAMRMRRNIIIGVYADSDGTLIGNRGGYDATRLFSPRLVVCDQQHDRQDWALRNRQRRPHQEGFGAPDEGKNAGPAR